MRAGILFGAASLIDGLRDRLGEIAGTPIHSILTGGDAQRLYPLTRSNWQCDSTLVLRGLCIAYERNKLTV
jgi:pantothenate kinase type III